MNKLIMNFLETEGYLEAAKEFEKESETELCANVALAEQRSRVRSCAQQGRYDYEFVRFTPNLSINRKFFLLSLYTW